MIATPPARLLPLPEQPAPALDPSNPRWQEANPGWRLTEAGERTRTTPPWMMVSLVFGLPFIILVLLGFVIR